MLSFQSDELASEHRTFAKGSEPSLTLMPGTKVESFDKFLPSRNDASYRAGIRALYGQLGSCKTQEGELVRTLGVTSCHRGEGKSTIAAELARVAAECQKTLLVKADDARFNLRNAMEDIVRRGLMHTDTTDKKELAES